MIRAIRFAVAATSITACGGVALPATDGGPTSSPSSSSGTAGGASGGSSSGTSGGSSTGGSSSAGPPISGHDAPTFGGADAGMPPTMPTPATDAAVLLTPRDAAVVRCNSGGPSGGGGGGGGGNGGPASCSAFANETCSGVSYSVSCACPQGTCACLGASSSIVAFTGCPVCPNSPQQLFAACGFPQ